MPTTDWNLKATWDAKYRIGVGNVEQGESDVKLHYNRAVMFEAIRRQTNAIYAALGWTPSTALIIIGGGYAWSEEVLRADQGMTDIVTVDTSTYIHDTASASEDQEIRDAIIAAGLDPDTGRGLGKFNQLSNPGNKSQVAFILDEDTLTIQGRNAIRAALGQNPDVVFSELVLDSLTDAEIPLASQAMNSFQGNPDVQHFVGVLQPGKTQDDDMNWKTLAEWKALIPGDTFVRTGTYEVL